MPLLYAYYSASMLVITRQFMGILACRVLAHRITNINPIVEVDAAKTMHLHQLRHYQICFVESGKISCYLTRTSSHSQKDAIRVDSLRLKLDKMANCFTRKSKYPKCSYRKDYVSFFPKLNNRKVIL